MEFKELNLHPDLQRGLDEAGFISCMPVQASVLSHSLSGEDIYAQSQTGTGKTAAFLVSVFQRAMSISELRTRKALILAPTRELAVQIEEECKRLGKHLPISSGAFYGGVGYGPQLDMLRDNVQIIIGTPGRIIDLVQQGKMLLREVGFLVIDEADRMFDMGFIDDLRKLIRYLPGPDQRQTFLFSATLNVRVKNLAWEYMHEPKEIVIEPEKVTVELVTQELYHVGSDEKFRLLLGLMRRESPQSAIIFCNQKYMVEELARRLNANGVSCDFIMGDLPQAKRLQIIDRLKAGNLEILVATDVAARGLDVEALDLVINYDLPVDAESYVHRIGRTARAGKSGKAISLACEKFVYGLPAIEKYIEQKIPVCSFDESLLAEDKSAGTRYSRPRYDDDRRSGSRRPDARGVRRGETRSGGSQRPDGRRRPNSDIHSIQRSIAEAAGRKAEQNEGKKAGKPRPEGAKARPAQREGQARTERTKRPEARDQAKLYQMSSDERMAHYKKVYGQGKAGQSPKEAPKRGESQTGPKQSRGQPNRQARGQGKVQRPSQAQGTPPNKGKPNPSHGSKQASPSQKPSLLDRIKGIFGGKKPKQKG